jgi:hypothetical protein
MIGSVGLPRQPQVMNATPIVPEIQDEQASVMSAGDIQETRKLGRASNYTIEVNFAAEFTRRRDRRRKGAGIAPRRRN